jgi:hypothetical protein
MVDGIALANTIFGVTPKAESGSLFVRAYPGNWAIEEGSGRFTLVHTASGIWLYFNKAKSCWTAEIAGSNEPLQVHGEVQTQKLSTVALSWGKKKGKRFVSLQADDSIEPCQMPFDSELSLAQLAQARVGGTLHGKDCWNGMIYCCVSDDRPIGSKSWDKYLSHRDLSPNPFDADRLIYAINNPR